MQKIPNAFQRSTLWMAITCVSITTIAAVLVGLIYLATKLIAFLQPILIPFAVAGVLAYLLEPVVASLAKRGIKRQHAVMGVFVLATGMFVGILFLIVPAVEKQTGEFAAALFGRVDKDGKTLDAGYLNKANVAVQQFVRERNDTLRDRFGVDLLHWNSPQNQGAPQNNGNTPPSSQPQTSPPNNAASPPDVPAPPPLIASQPEQTPPTPAVTPAPQAQTETANESIFTFDRDEPRSEASSDKDAQLKEDQAAYFTLQDLLSGDWLRNTLPQLGRNLWDFIRRSVGGFLGVFGFVLSLVIVPLYLYYFLTEGPKIAQTWSHYVPLRASEFKDEVVSTLGEINGYLIAFFRGQLVVSIINGIATGLGLVIVGVKFGWLIGLLLCILGIIPYLGIIVCWIPAVVIASLQGGSWMVSDSNPWWVLPLVVTAIFIVVQQVDGLFITPRVVGESVGLHPMTVIFSVFAWSLIMGGLLGAILAVPMTAALKVLFQRYVWQRALAPNTGHKM